MAMTMYEDSDPLEGLSEEDLQQLMDLGVIPQKQDALAVQLAQATKLRNQQGPQGRDSGRVYTAASPLEHIAHAAQGIQAGREMKRIGQQQEQLAKDQVAGRTAFLRAMYGKKPPISMAQMGLEIDPDDFKMPTVNF